MSTIRVNQFYSSTGTNQKTTEQFYKNRARKWVEFNGNGVIGIRLSSGVASISDLGTGIFRVNFSSTYVNSSYVVVGSVVGSTTATDRSVIIPNLTAKTTSNVAFEIRQPVNAALNDADYIGVAFIGGVT